MAARPAQIAGDIPIGIDLGTTYSLLAWLDADGEPRSLEVSPGEVLLPSAVLVDQQRIVVGKEALRFSVTAPDRFAESFKRDMGRSAYHRKIAGQSVPPEVFSGLVLEHLKCLAEQILGPVKKAVITVPAYFDELRRKATQEAGQLAGWEVLDIINEPTAAALCYGREMGLFGIGQAQPWNDRQRVVVYDLGGGTFDVSLLEIDGAALRTVAVDGDLQLGGRDFDERLVDYLAECFLAAYGIDPRSDPRDATQLWYDAQEVKHALSEGTKASTVCYHAGLRTRIGISRPEFESLTEDLLERTRETTELLIERAAVGWSKIDRVLAVGGATRMPMVPRMLRELTGKEPDRTLAPDEAVARGAALYAGMLLDPQGRIGGRSCNLINVNSHSLGVVGIDQRVGLRVNAVLIPRNTPIPTRAVKVFRTLREGQRTVSVQVLEGESECPEFCVTLGSCVVRDLPPELPQGAAVEVEYRYGADGRLSVAARIPSTGQSAAVEIQRDRPLLDGDLAAWKARLIDRRMPVPPAPHEAAPGGVDLNDRASIIRRLDVLYAGVGRVAAGAAVPPACLAVRQTAVSAAEECRLARRRVAEVEWRREGAVGTAEAVLAGTELARARMVEQTAARDMDFAYLVLGREIANADFVLPGAEVELEEIKYLRGYLK